MKAQIDEQSPLSSYRRGQNNQRIYDTYIKYPSNNNSNINNHIH